ncbi:MAG: citrate (Si)-synthase [Ignavibacteriaceae bacterium]|jgi:Citrate synthase|nr:MAG: citrate (Si)-synthase [Chlorobiota bacterium]KXK06429.1 MAG: Citrate synthase [Chlorobi bacterium OLB4]MBV6399059.1 Citrate synthase [Ignavibacteria bacterium]MCC6885277.1 citrate (Si)-synthase [Ignavibacteriales bacterium]MCE7953321.1 citrate (Si)-synthase [Chlorobi bacterium CHB7]MDL1887262.1 citrate (Si)-synthase [Ignavibacteria bacterium CHB1]MEB2330137.1 citrate (Si)-synthase [Ignavibacteriaceae bacterium]OQY78199.1 MAG: type I citrate synthase [Ignavibacteriales bacterium UTCHB
MILKDKLASQIPALREEARSIVANNGDKAISGVTIEQLFGGMRGVKSLICDTSEVGLDTGVIIRGYPILELTNKIPEEIFYLLVSGELPDSEGLKDLQAELQKRSEVPQYIWDMLNTLPSDSHPMMMLNSSILALQHESIFAKRYDEGISKDDYWDPMFEDCLNLIAKMPVIAAYIYRKRFNKGERIESDKTLDWAANFGHMLGIAPGNESFKALMRLYMVLHSDHESGNVSAFSCQTIGSTLSDVYYSVSGGLSGLAGPLHGLANQENLRFIVNMREEIGHSPTDEEVKEYCLDVLAQKRVIPGYGHAVLRVTDPRFTAFLNFGKEEMKDDEIFKIVRQLFEIVPKILIEQGKAKSPWPNVDAVSGSLLYHFGLKEYIYYTVLFSLSRTLGLTSQLIIARAMHSPLIRPKSVTTKWVKSQIGN